MAERTSIGLPSIDLPNSNSEVEPDHNVLSDHLHTQGYTQLPLPTSTLFSDVEHDVRFASSTGVLNSAQSTESEIKEDSPPHSTIELETDLEAKLDPTLHLEQTETFHTLETQLPSSSLTIKRSFSDRNESNTLKSQLNMLPLLSVHHNDEDAYIMKQSDLIIDETIGLGGAGYVQKGIQSSLGREVAIKRIKGEWNNEKQMLRLIQEAQLAGRLEHPNIIPIHLLAQTQEGEPLLIMKKVEGVAWTSLLNHEEPLWSYGQQHALMEQFEYFIKVCLAVEYAHKHDIVHLDIKPDNVMIGHYGEVYLVDWGIALPLNEINEENQHHVVGTPYFIAPEMVRGLGEVDTRSDIAILGATLHYVVTGQYRHNGKSTLDVLCNAYKTQDYLYPLEVHTELAQLLNRACAKDKKERFQSVKELREALESYIQHRVAFDLLDQSFKQLQVLKTSYKQFLSDSSFDPSTSINTYRKGIDVPEPVLLNFQEFRESALECRLLVNQALLVIPHHRPAYKLLDDILSLWTTFEIDQEQDKAAQSLYKQMRNPSPQLGQSLKELRQKKQNQQESKYQLDQLTQSISFEGSLLQARMLIGNGVLWFLFLLTLGYLQREKVFEITQLDNLYMSSIGLIFTLFTMWSFRKLFTDTLHRRSFTECFIFYLFLGYSARFIYQHLDLSFQDSLFIDFLLFTLFLTSCTSLVHRSIKWSVAVGVGCLITALYLEHYTLELLGIYTLIANINVSYVVKPKPSHESVRQG